MQSHLAHSIHDVKSCPRSEDLIFLSIPIPTIAIVQVGRSRFLHGHVLCLFHFLGGGEIDSAVEENQC